MTAACSSDPTSFRDDMRCDQRELWRDAIGKEYSSLLWNETSKPVFRQSDQNVVSSKYVLVIRQETKSSEAVRQRFKERLVAKELSKIEAIHSEKAYTPVVKLVFVRVFLTVVKTMNVLLQQMDVVIAFLNGDLEERLYKEQPEDFRTECQENVVCRLENTT